MGENTKIEWCHHSFNPWIGCTKVSPGCAHCYAEVETFARVQRKRGNELWGKDANRHVTSDANWRKPYKWNDAATAAGERHRVFCASLSDVFEDRRDLDEPRRKLWDLIETTPNLDWLLLTKRPENIARLIDQRWLEHPRHNVWLGTTCEDQKRADERIPHLLRVPAAVRFLSCEPLLGPVDLDFWIDSYWDASLKDLMGNKGSWVRVELRHERALHWVIAGGESGLQARPMRPTWVRSVRNQCARAGVPFLFKQWGEWVYDDSPANETPDAYLGKPCLTHVGGQRLPDVDGHRTQMVRIGKEAAGRLLDGREWNEYPVVASEAIA